MYMYVYLYHVISMYYACIICSFLKLILAPCFPSITSNCRFGLELLPWTGLLVPMMPTEPKENKSQQST